MQHAPGKGGSRSSNKTRVLGLGPGAGFNIRGQAAESEAGLLRHQDRVPSSARRDNMKIISADAP